MSEHDYAQFEGKKDHASVEAMRVAWEALRAAKGEAKDAYDDALAAVGRVEGAQFLSAVQDAKRAGLAKYTVSRATGVRAWPKIREWWGDDATPTDKTVGPVLVQPDVDPGGSWMAGRAPVSTLLVDGHDLKAVDRLGVTQIFLDGGSLFATKDSDGVVSWFSLPNDGGEDEALSFSDRLEQIPESVEDAVRGNVWEAPHE